MVEFRLHAPVAYAPTGVVMEQAENVFVTYGCDKLPREILSIALSTHGWRLDSPPTTGETSPVTLVLVYNARSTLGLENVRRARTEYPTAPVLLLTGAITETELLQFIEAGVCSYISTHQRFSDLIEAMRLTLASCTRSSGRVLRLVVEDIRRITRQSGDSVMAPLTAREQQILSFLTQGLSNKEIATRLSIAPNTVKHHVHNLLEKLHAKNRNEAAWLDIRSSVRKANPMVNQHAGRR